MDGSLGWLVAMGIFAIAILSGVRRENEKEAKKKREQMQNSKFTTLEVCIPRELKERLEHYKNESGVSIDEIFKEAFEEYLEQGKIYLTNSKMSLIKIKREIKL
ncbi:MAG: ribbon-helix-helix domain-containing protein [Thiovulaceae bacterium]|nr:ribbon-helix-helix domain-containing protein [Sulfurimonadaceae bacterium]